MIPTKKKLLVILNRLVIGGQALDTIPLIYHLQEHFDILVLYGCPEKDEQEALFLLEAFKNIPLKKIIYFRRKFNPVRDILSFFSIFHAIRKFKPGVLHTHGLKSGFFGRTAAYLNGVPCIIHTFHGHHFHSYVNSFLSKSIVFYERAMAKITSKIIAISPTQKIELANTYKIAAPGKIETIRLGIEEKLFYDETAGKRMAFRRKYSLAANVVAIGIIGRIVAIKNYGLFVKIASSILATATAEVKFFVVGDGVEKQFVQGELTRLNIQWCGEGNLNNAAQVIFTSWLPEVSKALYGLDIIMLTSHNEGTPLSIIEAQFCGKPVVATNVGGVRDTFIDNETGFLVAPGNDAVFTEKLAMLVENNNLRSEMGKKAAVFAHENFSKTKEIDSFRQLYQTCNK